MMAFASVWGFGNVVNNFAQQGLTVVFSWVFMMALYFIPYALMVGELGSVYKDEKGGVGSWIRKAPWVNPNTGVRMAYLAGFTYWVVHIPYLAQKPQQALIAAGWSLRGDGLLTTNFSPVLLQFSTLLIFIFFLMLSARGVSSIKRVGTIAGMASLVLSILYILLAVAAPALRDVPIATANINIKSFIPHFDLTYLTTISMLVFAVGGAEKISPYVNNVEGAGKNFPKAMILLAVMVAFSAIMGSIAMGMMFDANNRPADLMMNGHYYAFAQLGEYYGVGKTFLIIFAITNFAGQIAALMFSIDAPLKVMLLDADERYVPHSLTKVNAHGAPINGYILTALLVGIVIMLPAIQIGNMNDLYAWLLRLNSIVMPMRYLWVFFAYIILRSARNAHKQKTNTGYQFVKNSGVARAIGWWCFGFTAFACVLGVIPKSGDPDYTFKLMLNILFPVFLISLGFIMPLMVKHKKRAS